VTQKRIAAPALLIAIRSWFLEAQQLRLRRFLQCGQRVENRSPIRALRVCVEIIGDASLASGSAFGLD
jgi:hypothetical protein